MNIEKLGLREQLNSDPETEINIIPYKPFKVDFKISGSGLYKVGDGWFGHRIFLAQGDTVYIKLIQLPNVEKRLQNGENLTKFHIMKVKAKYPGNLTFFDEMEKNNLIKLFPFINSLILENGRKK